MSTFNSAPLAANANASDHIDPEIFTIQPEYLKPESSDKYPRENIYNKSVKAAFDNIIKKFLEKHPEAVHAKVCSEMFREKANEFLKKDFELNVCLFDELTMLFTKIHTVAPAIIRNATTEETKILLTKFISKIHTFFTVNCEAYTNFDDEAYEETCKIYGIKIHPDCIQNTQNSKYANVRDWFSTPVTTHNPVVSFEYCMLIVAGILDRKFGSDFKFMIPLIHMLDCINQYEHCIYFVYHYCKFLRLYYLMIHDSVSKSKFFDEFLNVKFGFKTDSNIEAYGDIRMSTDANSMTSMFSQFTRSLTFDALNFETLWFNWNDFGYISKDETLLSFEISRKFKANEYNILGLLTDLSRKEAGIRRKYLNMKQRIPMKTFKVDYIDNMKPCDKILVYQQQMFPALVKIVKNLKAIPEKFYNHRIGFVYTVLSHDKDNVVHSYVESSVSTYTVRDLVISASIHNTLMSSEFTSIEDEPKEPKQKSQKNTPKKEVQPKEIKVKKQEETADVLKEITEYVPTAYGEVSRATRIVYSKEDKIQSKQQIKRKPMHPKKESAEQQATAEEWEKYEEWE